MPKAENGLKFLLVSRTGYSICRLWDALTKKAGVAERERGGKKPLVTPVKNGLM